ncbi:MAG: 2-phospho-L-lactate guanylyltransferase [Actinomycetota bacterium]
MSMPIIVVPAKPLARAKQRLSGVLDLDQRKRLCLSMLADVCKAASRVGRVIVVGSDPDTFDVARASGAEIVEDPTPNAGLNPSLEAAIPMTDEGVLVLSSDVPAVHDDEIAMMFGEGVRLAPDAKGVGTNALWRKPSGIIPLAFGDQSASAHEKLAREKGVAFELVNAAGLALDVDEPRDLLQAWDADIGASTRQALASLGLPHHVAEFDIVQP